MPIEKLTEFVISQIAAGEVVERPSSVVKELIENSLDAGATHVAVEVQEGGRKLIRVSDDGSGIPSQEVRLALARHATSKLKNADDLYAIQTLGFRGEALSSIVAVSRTTLVTRHRQENMGIEVHIEGGEIHYEKGKGVPAGTVMSVENLFFNTPARLKFLKTENTEKRHIYNLITDYAMAYPHVKFTLLQDGRETFRSTGSGHLADVAVKVFGLDVFKQMLEVYGEEVIQHGGDKIIVQGYVTMPEMNRNDRSRIVLFVNGRAVQDSGLVYGITQAYQMLMEKGRYPYAMLMLSVPTDFVDVNVHPTKAEVRFQDNNITFVAVQRAVREVLLKSAKLSVIQHNELATAPIVPRTAWHNSANRTSQPQQDDMGFTVESYSRPRPTPDMSDDDLAYIPEGAGKPSKPRTLPPLRVMGQIGAMYIIAEGPAGLYLVDQYAASERVVFEELTENFATLGENITVLNGATIDLTAKQFKSMEPHIEDLARLGLQLEPFGNTTLAIRAIPSAVQARDAIELVGRIVLGLEQGDTFPHGFLMRIAQIGAIKNGQALTTEQMQHVIRKLERCPDPLISPSGRATLVHMSSEQLAREFSKKR
jgi:DNA mismatch repair protein MutL